jgi:Raf kinase inhibitor-like YbhB/YbcL family protein
MRAAFTLCLGLAVVAVAIAAAAAAAAAPSLAAGLTVTSPDFQTGGQMPTAQICARYGGADRSPALAWSGEPKGTQSFAVTMFDPDAPTGNGFWHWIVFNIPASVHSLPAGAGDPGSQLLPLGAGEGLNDGGTAQYFGICPPPGPPHHYRITVYAVKVPKLELNAESSGAAASFNLHSNTLATGQIVGVYGRPTTP